MLCPLYSLDFAGHLKYSFSNHSMFTNNFIHETDFMKHSRYVLQHGVMYI
jgi:hypothetical protein